MCGQALLLVVLLSNSTTDQCMPSQETSMEKPLYAPYKAVGYVTDGVPFVVNQLGDELFLLVSIGRAIQIFKLDRLTSCLVSQQLPSAITSLVVCLTYYIYYIFLR